MNDDQNQNPNDTIIEAEIVQEVDESPTVSVSDSVGGADTLIALTNLIQSYIQNLERAQQELSTHKQMLTDGFGNDLAYREAEEKAKQVVKEKTAIKTKILKQPALMQLSAKVKEMSQSVKEMRETLSSYLQDYAKLTGSNEFEDAEGEVREIVYSARLVKTSARRQK